MMITRWRGGKHKGVMAMLAMSGWSMCLACERPDEGPARSVFEVERRDGMRRGRVLLHPSQAVLERHLDAYLYRDEEGALKTHIQGTSQTPWCEASFKRVLIEVAKKRSEESCRQARELSQDVASFARLDEEEQFMTQTLRFVCEKGEDADCVEYGREVYRSALEGASLWQSSFRGYKVEKMYEDGDEVTAYIEVRGDASAGETPRRATARLQRVGEGWRVVGLVEVGGDRP